MPRSRSVALLLLPVLFLPLGYAPANAAEVGGIRYVSDNLTVPLRSGPSNGHRILHRGLPSGTRLTVLGEDADAGFINIRTDRGTEGWIPTQYLVAEPIAP